MTANKFYTSYFRLSITDYCNLSCYFCYNEGQFSLNKQRDYLSSDDIIWMSQIAYNQGCTKYKITGGEPTLRNDIPDIVNGIKAMGAEDVALITNGIHLSEYAEPLYNNGLDRLIVSVYSFDDLIYKQMTGGTSKSMRQTIQGIDKALNYNFKDIRINFLFNNTEARLDDLRKTLAFAKSRNIKVLVFPIFHYNIKPQDQIYSFDELRQIIVTNFGVKSDRILTDKEGFRKVEITTASDEVLLLKLDTLSDRQVFHACARCQHKAECREGYLPLRLSAKGVLYPCLAQGIPGIDVFESIKNRDTQSIEKVLQYINSL